MPRLWGLGGKCLTGEMLRVENDFEFIREVFNLE